MILGRSYRFPEHTYSGRHENASLRLPAVGRVIDPWPKCCALNLSPCPPWGHTPHGWLQARSIARTLMQTHSCETWDMMAVLTHRLVSQVDTSLELHCSLRLFLPNFPSFSLSFRGITVSLSQGSPQLFQLPFLFPQLVPCISTLVLVYASQRMQTNTTQRHNQIYHFRKITQEAV